MCDECGAPDKTCEARFHECLAREFENPAFGRVHNLTVSAYMLQHSSKLTSEGWLYERDLLREFIINDMPPEQVRKERKDEVDGGKRAFTIKSRTGQPVIARMEWSKTILDVRLEGSRQYCEDVIIWASATLADSENVSA
ncbi:MAG TPA: DUF5946 family protein [Anaerolineales bacterium]|nr:DUF5946 family protein [Anaerolineales bacterium]